MVFNGFQWLHNEKRPPQVKNLGTTLARKKISTNQSKSILQILKYKFFERIILIDFPSFHGCKSELDFWKLEFRSDPMLLRE